MPDMLIKLYEFADGTGYRVVRKERITAICKPIGPKTLSFVAWVFGQFGAGWVAETEAAIFNRPCSCSAAVKDA